MTTLWMRYRYFFWSWVVITAIVLVCYETQFDRERICTYQYCPSRWVLAFCTGTLFLGMVWVEFFFNCLRPILQIKIGQILGTRIQLRGERTNSLFESLFSTHGDAELWEAAKDAGVVKQVFTFAADFLSIIFFLMIPIAIIISLSSGAAYLEQINSPPPTGLIKR